MEIYAHDDKALEAHSEIVNKYLDSYIATGNPFWVAINESKAIGAVMAAVEPVRLIAPIGTPMSLLAVFDYDAPTHVLKRFASEGLRIAKEHDAHYSFIDVPEKHRPLIEHFKTIGYQEMARSLRMSRNLDEDFEDKGELRYEKVERNELDNFMRTMKEFMSGSPDIMLNTILENFSTFPDEMLDVWYGTELLYTAYKDSEMVGVLDLSPGTGTNISNVGVSPKCRGKGYGRMIMNFALRTLKEIGDERGSLRVHVDNERAIGLYESLGFAQHSSNSALIWWK